MFYHSNLKDIQDDNSESDPTDIILFMFFGLLIGVITLQILSRLGDPLPYTVVIFFIGIIFSFNNDYHDNEGMWGNSIYKWSRIDAELMLYIFLPPLIFGEAMNLNWFFVQNAFLQSCLLAGPGVLLTTVFMGLLCKVILPYHWSWYLCFTFGAVISASDTVAVLAILKESGASPKLTMLIVGESLLNDGTAIVLFTLFFDLLLGQSYTGGQILLFFFNCCIGSPLFGIACGLVIVRWLRTVNRSLKEVDTIIQICITICCAYLIFFIAQNPLQVSGALACCGAGTMLAWLAPPLILNHETMHNIWSIIEWMGNTLIFLLAGLIIGTRTFEHIYLLDWGYMVLLYIIVMAVRFVVVFMLYPLLSTIGYKCTRKEAVFMSWGCLRGALAMALALIVEKEGDSSNTKDQSSRFFFYIGGIATLTLLVNGTTAGKLLEKLGLMGEHSVEKDIIMTQMRKRLRKKMNKIVNELQVEMDELGHENVDLIRQSCTLLRESEFSERFLMTNDPSDLLADITAASMLSPQEHDQLSERGDLHENRNAVHSISNKLRSLSKSKSASDLRTRSSSFNTISMSTTTTAAAAAAKAADNGNIVPSAPQPYLSRQQQQQQQQLQQQQQHRTTRTKSSPYAIGGRTNSHSNQSTAAAAAINRVFSSTKKSTDQSQASHNSKRWDTRNHSLARMKHLSRGRPMNGAIMNEVLSFVRTIFLEIVRVNYWHDIESGKLPRLSFSARFLLYSIDVGLDSVSNSSVYLQDWACIEYELDRTPLSIRILTALEAILPMDTSITRLLARLEGRREKRAVYMLTSFIDAHTTAQKKMHSYVGLEDEFSEDDSTSFLPEEVKVKNESIALVEIAKRRLNAINTETITSIRVKQVSQMLLAKEAALVKGMLNEGLLSTKDAEEFLDEISEDAAKIESDRNKQYWESDSTLRRSEYRQASRESYEGYSFAFGNSSNSSSSTNTGIIKGGIASATVNAPLLHNDISKQQREKEVEEDDDNESSDNYRTV